MTNLRSRALWILAVVAACKGDGRSAGGQPTPIGPAPPDSARAGTAPAAGDANAGGGAAPTGPPTTATAPAEPPSEALTQPPVSIAQTVTLAPFASGFDRPVGLVAAPGDARRRLFVVEQTGRIRTIEGGTPQPKAFLDLSRAVTRGIEGGSEQGLLGLAFHPRFAENGKLYVNYTDREGDTRIVEYKASGDAADPASARELLRIAQPYGNHNGGHLVFGPDGALWIGTGDGGAAGDPRGNGQDPDALLGKMLRLDVDAPSPEPEIVSIGLRNPWRYDFDAKTGDLYIADVGQNAWEYVFVVPADRRTGHNFGWNVVEGRHCYRADRCDTSRFTLPVAEYPHADGCSITGGTVYRGKALPQLDGLYFYADYCTGLVRSFRWAKDGIRAHWDWKATLDPESTLAQLSSFGTDHDGELYLVSLGGDVYRFVPRR